MGCGAMYFYAFLPKLLSMSLTAGVAIVYVLADLCARYLRAGRIGRADGLGFRRPVDPPGTAGKWDFRAV